MSELRPFCVVFVVFWLSSGLLHPVPGFAMEGPAGGENDPFAAIGSEASAQFFTGAASVSVPILIPPGRAQTTPDLGLAYSSHAGLSPAGLGWSFTTGVLARSTKWGVPRCDGEESRDFQVSLGGSQDDLVETSPNAFHLEIDEGYAEVFLEEYDNRWILRSREGLRYTFGGTPESRVHTGADVFRDAASCEFTTAWHLTRIEDPNGNHVEIAYDKSGNTPIPVSIEYGGNDSAGISDPFRVRLELEELPLEKPRWRHFRSGVDQRLERRIRRIFVESWDVAGHHYSEIRRYGLEYDDSPDNHAFLLKSIEATGLPRRTFDYAASTPTIVEATSGEVPADSIYLNRQFPTGPILSNRDMNGDGLLDRIRVYGADFRVRYGESEGPNQFSAVEYAWSIPQGPGIPQPDRIGAEDFGQDYYLVTDLTGDGKPDFVFRDVPAGTIRVFRGECGEHNRDCGFSDVGETWTNPGNQSIRFIVASVEPVGGGRMVFRDLFDMNGDGLPDLVRGVPNGMEVYRNLGFDFESEAIFIETGENYIAYDSDGATYTVGHSTQMLDVNGDGLPDRVRAPAFQNWTDTVDPPGPRLPYAVRYRAPHDYFGVDPDGQTFGPYPLHGGPYLCPADPGAPLAGITLCRSNGSPTLPWGWAIVPAMSVQLGTGQGLSERIYSPAPYAISVDGAAPRLRSSTISTSSQSVFPYRNFVDMNGDGLVDWVASALPGAAEFSSWAVLYNQGDGRFGIGDLDRVVGAPAVAPGVVISNYGSVLPRQIIETGWRWLGQTHFHTSSTPDGLSEQYSHVFDLDGDGLPEMVTSVGAATGRWNLRRIEYQDASGKHLKPHLLVQARDGVGGRTVFEYAPSSAFVGTGASQASLPLSLWVVTGIRRTDGLCDDEPVDWFSLAGNPCLAAGHERVQSVAYRNGAFDPEEREFRGFREVTVFDGPVEQGTERRLEFYQDGARKGKLASEEIYLGGVDLFTRTTYDWRTASQEGRTQVYLQEQRIQEFVLYPDSSNASYTDQCVVHRNSLEMPSGSLDPFGRIQASCSMACEGALSSDDLCDPNPVGKKEIRTTWAEPIPGAGFPVWDRPFTVMNNTVSSEGETELAGLTVYAYDQLEMGIDRGNLSKEVGLVASLPFAWVEKRMTYDNDSGPGVGNLVSIVVPVAGQSREPDRIFYDPEFQLYAEIESVPSTLNRAGETIEHRTRTTYDLRYGKITSRVGRQGAARGDVHGTLYDSLGRPVCRYEPGTDCEGGLGGSAFSASLEIEYGYGNPTASDPIERLNWTEVRQREPNAPRGYLVSRTYRDALGRERLSLHERYVVAPSSASGAPAMETVVARHLDYAPHGEVSRQWAPYALGSGSSALLSLTAPPGTAAVEFDYALNGNGGFGGGLGFFDPAGRPFRTRSPDGSETRRHFLGRTRLSVDGEGNHVREDLDAHGRVHRKQVFEGASTRLTSVDREYDAGDRVVREIFGEDPATAIVQRFDLFGRLIEKIDPDSGVWTARFDEAGNKIFSNDPEPNQSIQTCYDELDRVVLQCARASDVYDASLCGQAEPSCLMRYEYAYDESSAPDGSPNAGVGRLTRVDGPESTHRYVYDVRGRVTRQIDEVLGVEAVTDYEYAPDLDRLERMIYPDGERVRYGYDPSGQPRSVWQEGENGRRLASYVSSATYDLRGRALRVTRGNGTREDFAYHAESEGFRPSGVRVENTLALSNPSVGSLDAVLVDVRFDDYDANGRLTRVVDQRDSAGSLSMSADYAYDGAGRLTGVSGPHPESFEYDAIGNLLSIDGAVGRRVFSRSAAAQSSLGPHQHDRFGVAGQVGWNMAFDANGRRIQKVRSDGSASQAYEYGPFGRLRRLTVAGVAKTLGYDHVGFRVHETRAGRTRRFFGRHAESEEGRLFKYYRMGDRLIATRVVASPELSGLGSPATPLQIPPVAYWWAMSAVSLLLLVPLGRTRVALGVRISQGGALATAVLVATVMLPLALGVGCVETPDIRHYHTSHRGSPVAITGGSGELLRQIRYSAYGEVRRFDGEGDGTGVDPSNRLEFTGYATDPESELQYAGSRFYDPSQARFLSMDPREVDPNPYAYVGWDPVNFVDPNGEAGIESLFLGLLGVAAALAALQGIVVAIQTSSVTNGFKAAALSFATAAIGAISSILVPQALALVPMVTQGLAQASVAAVGMGYSVYGLTRVGSTEDAVFAGVGLVVSLALAAYGMRSGIGRQATSTTPGKPVSGNSSPTSPDTASAVALARGGGQRMDLIQQMLSILRNRAEAASIQRAQLENQSEILRLRSEAIRDRTVRGRPVLDQNVSAFEVYEFTVDSLGNQSFNSSIVAIEFSPGGSPLPTHPSVIGASGSHLMTVTTGPHPVACGRCRGVLVH